MAVYDMRCVECATVVEVRCSMSEREIQTCATCNEPLTPLFSPPTNIVIPNAFHYAFSDLFGTSSEKDFLKENPNLERVSKSGLDDSDRARKRRQRDKEIKEGLDVEKALLAQGKLKKPITVESGSMQSDIA